MHALGQSCRLLIILMAGSMQSNFRHAAASEYIQEGGRGEVHLPEQVRQQANRLDILLKLDCFVYIAKALLPQTLLPASTMLFREWCQHDTRCFIMGV